MAIKQANVTFDHAGHHVEVGDLFDSGHLLYTLFPTRFTDSGVALSSATVPVLPASNGSDDTTALNAVLASGGRVRGKPGETYLVTAPLVLPSNTELDMTDCTINLIGSNGRLLRNYSLGAAAVRTVADAAITTATKTLTSATGAFTAADKGRSVAIAGAGMGGAILNTQIVTVTDGTTVVIDVAATTTVSGAPLSLYDRDTNITVRGGIWTRDATASSSHLLMFHRVDRGTFRDLKVVTAHGKFSICAADATKILVTNINGDSFSDLVHVQGPASRITIDTITGKSGDDFVAVGGRDYAGYELTTDGGDISSVTVRNLDGTTSGNGNICHLWAGLNVKCRNVTIDGVRGTPGGQVVGLADDPNNAPTTGMDIDGILVRDVKGTTTVAGFAQVLIAGIGVKQVVVDGVTITQATNNCSGLLLSGTLTAQSITLRNLEINSAANHVGINCQTGAVIANLIVDGYVGVLDPAITNGQFATITGQITGLFSISNAQQKQGASFVKHNGTTALVVAANNCWISGSVGFYSSSSAALTILCGAVWSPGSTTFQITGTGSLTIIGGPLSAAALFKSGTQNCRINAPTFIVDVTKVNLPTAGDRVYNSNAAAASGVGLVAYNGVAWVLANTGAVKTGTAVLVAGTVVVADTAITANSIIRLTAKTLGGTAGALFVSARSAGVSFAITSTNGADTSTVQYEILAY